MFFIRALFPRHRRNFSQLPFWSPSCQTPEEGPSLLHLGIFPQTSMLAWQLPKNGQTSGTSLALYIKSPCNTASRTKSMRRVRRNTMAESEANARQTWQTTSAYINLNQSTISQSKCVVFKIRNSLRAQHVFFPTPFVRQKDWNTGKHNEPIEPCLLCTFVVIGFQHVVFAARPKSICTWDFSVWMLCPVCLNVLAFTLMMTVCIPWTIR